MTSSFSCNSRSTYHRMTARLDHCPIQRWDVSAPRTQILNEQCMDFSHISRRATGALNPALIVQIELSRSTWIIQPAYIHTLSTFVIRGKLVWAWKWTYVHQVWSPQLIANRARFFLHSYASRESSSLLAKRYPFLPEKVSCPSDYWSPRLLANEQQRVLPTYHTYAKSQCTSKSLRRSCLGSVLVDKVTTPPHEAVAPGFGTLLAKIDYSGLVPSSLANWICFVRPFKPWRLIMNSQVRTAIVANRKNPYILFKLGLSWPMACHKSFVQLYRALHLQFPPPKRGIKEWNL